LAVILRPGQLSGAKQDEADAFSVAEHPRPVIDYRVSRRISASTVPPVAFGEDQAEPGETCSNSKSRLSGRHPRSVRGTEMIKRLHFDAYCRETGIWLGSVYVDWSEEHAQRPIAAQGA
jgi:hypothetical protein